MLGIRCKFKMGDSLRPNMPKLPASVRFVLLVICISWHAPEFQKCFLLRAEILIFVYS